MIRSFITLLFLAGLLGCQGEASLPEARVLQVATFKPERHSSYELQRRFVGRVNASQRVDVGFEQAGKLESVQVEEGDLVAAGDIVAQLDSRLLHVERRELEAQLSEVGARLALVRSSLSRQQSLKQQGFSAEQQLDELGAEEKVLLASRERLQAGLSANELALEKANLVAPYDGVVSQRYLDLGAVVAPGTPVLQLLEAGELEALVGVPVAMTRDLEVGEVYAVEVGRDKYSATLLAIGSDLDPVTRTVSLRLALPADAPRDGELALLHLAEARYEQGYWLPVSALIDGLRGLWNCYIIEPDPEVEGRYRVVAVNAQVLHVEQERVYVAAELEGKRVISRGLHRVVPGQLVRIDDEVAGQ